MNLVTILIVDDDNDDVELFCEAAHEVDPAIQCISAGNGEEALRILNDHKQVKPDFIFLDLNMPRMNGIQFMELFRKDEVLTGIPVIIYTTSKLVADREQTKALGAVCFLTKPSKLNDLKNAISMVLAKDWDRMNASHFIE